MKQYFNKDGVAYLKEDATLLKSLISFFTTWDQFWGIVYDSKPSTWKTILTDRKWILPINNLLDKELPSLGNCLKSLNVNFNDVQNRVHEDLFCSDLLSNIEEECRLNWRYETYALYPPYANASWKKYVIGDNRNKIFSELIAKDNITTEQKIKQIPFYWGWELYFTTKNNNKKYQWWYALKEQNQKGEWVIVPDVNLDNLKTYLIQTSLL